MVNVVVVRLVVHHPLQVVVVAHLKLNSLRVGLAQRSLCIVGHVVAVLIPVHRSHSVQVGYSVGVGDGIGRVGEEFPS